VIETMRIAATLAIGAAATLALAACGSEPEPEAPKGPVKLSTEQIAQRAKYGVAYIKSTDFGKSKQIGTGFVISSNPEKTRIVTAAHVLGEGIEASIGGQPKQSARLINEGGCRGDVGIIEIDTPPKVRVLPTRAVPASVGMKVVMMGYSSTDISKNAPKEAAVKEGSVSRAQVRNLSLGKSEPKLPVAIQTSAPTNPADSGAPLFDETGSVVGLVVSKEVDADNVGHALPMSFVQPLVEDLSDGRNDQPGWELWAVDRSFPYRTMVSAMYPDLGSGLAREVARILRNFDERGLLVVDSEEGRPAGKLPPGVLIQSLNGSDVETAAEACRVWASASPGSVVRVTGLEMFSAGEVFDAAEPFYGRMKVPR
jgi:S1-C subfamily serine protease